MRTLVDLSADRIAFKNRIIQKIKSQSSISHLHVDPIVRLTYKVAIDQILTLIKEEA